MDTGADIFRRLVDSPEIQVLIIIKTILKIEQTMAI